MELRNGSSIVVLPGRMFTSLMFIAFTLYFDVQSCTANPETISQYVRDALRAAAERRPVTDPVADYRQRYNRNPPHGFDKWVEFARNHNCSFDPEFYEWIERDMGRFRHPTDPTRRTITREMMEKAAAMALVNAFRPGKGDLPAVFSFMQWDLLPNDLVVVVNALDECRVLPADPHLPPVQNNTYVSIDDMFSRSQCMRDKLLQHRYTYGMFLEPDPNQVRVRSELVPVFSQSKFDCFGDILAPLGLHYNAAEDYLPTHKLTPWTQREPKFYWRGGTTGGGWGEWNHSYWWRGHRQLLVEEAVRLKRTNHTLAPFLDVAFYTISQCVSPQCERMKQHYRHHGMLKKARFPHIQHRMKYLFDVDGNGWSSRFPKILSGGSLILKMAVAHEYLDTFIKPYVHYIPLANDYHNLTDAMEWVLKHDAEAAEIAQRGAEMTRNRLRPSDMHCYNFRLLLEYGALAETSDPRFGVLSMASD